MNALPVTLHGLVDFHIANALAAVAACRAHGMEPTVIASALQTFDGVGHNAGRANLYQVRGGYVFVDYGHNADAFAAIGRMVTHLSGYRITGVMNVPGDRAERLIVQAGQVAAHVFHRVLLWMVTIYGGGNRG